MANGGRRRGNGLVGLLLECFMCRTEIHDGPVVTMVQKRISITCTKKKIPRAYIIAELFLAPPPRRDPTFVLCDVCSCDLNPHAAMARASAPIHVAF